MIHPTLDAPRRDGADLSHHPELDHPKPSAKRKKPSRLPLGYLNAKRPHGPELGHLQIRRPLKLRSQAEKVGEHHLYQVNAGAVHPANARSVTRAFPTTGKPVDHRDVSKIARIAGKAGNPALGDFLNLRESP